MLRPPLAALVAVLAAVPLAAAEKPAGSFPLLAGARVDGDKVLIDQIIYRMAPEQRVIQEKVGDQIVARPVVVQVPVAVQETLAFALKDVQFFDTANKPVEAKAAAEQLKKGATVVVSTDGQKVNDRYLKVLKEGTLVLVVPAGRLNRPAVPPPPPAVPPAEKGPAIREQAIRALGALAADEPKGEKVESERYSGYFESNKSGLKGDTSFLAFTDQKSFDMIFGKAVVMGSKAKFLPADAFESKLVVATIKRGKMTVDYKVDKVTADDGVLYVSYSTTSKASPSATFATPLILSVDKGKYKSVVFIENGKKVGTAEVGK